MPGNPVESQKVLRQKSKVKFYFRTVRSRVIPILKRVEVGDYPSKIARTRKIKTQPGDQAILYQLTSRAYLAILLDELNLHDFVRTASEESIITTLAALISHTRT